MLHSGVCTKNIMGKLFRNSGKNSKTSKSGLNFRDKFTLALPGPASVIGQIIIHNVMMKFYTDIIGLDAKFYGYIYLIYSIWNAINDPLLGAYIDRMPFNKKRGKYVYLMKVTAPITLISIFGMLLSRPAWNEWVIFGVLLVELFIYDTAYTVFSVAYQSYFLIAAPSKEARVDVEIIRTYLGNVVGAIVTTIPTLLLVGDGPRHLILPVFSLIIVINAALYFYSFKYLKDKASMYAGIIPESEKRPFYEVWKDAKEIIFTKPFLTYLLFYITARGALSSYYNPFLYYMDHVAKASPIMATVADTLPGLIMLALLPGAGKLIKKYGSKKITIYAFIPALLGFSGLLFGNAMWITVCSYVLIVLALNVIQTSGVVMNGALIDYDEMRTGVRKTGLYGGLFSLLATSLIALQDTVFANVISHYGYNGALAEQSAEAIKGIRIGAGLVPIIMCLVGFIPLMMFPINLKLEQEISDFCTRTHRGEDEDGNPTSIPNNRREVEDGNPTSILNDRREDEDENPADTPNDNREVSSEVSSKALHKKYLTQDNHFVDEAGNQVTLHGVNMVCKDRNVNHIGQYTDEDFKFLADHGMNLIRFGIFWESVEPAPGKYDEEYLDKVEEIINMAGRNGLSVYLDMHQDLFSAEFEDGAPGWATVTDGATYEKTELWSDAYLISEAVQNAFDNFWANTPAEDGVGIQDRFAAMWQHLAKRFAKNPYVVGYDFFNEPFPGSAAASIVVVLGSLKEKILSGNITEEDLFATISAIEPITAAFEENTLIPFYEKVARAVREEDKLSFIALENNYFSNAGIPTHVRPVTYADGTLIEHQIFAPHGYDIFVDTDDYDNGDTSRVDLIFGTHAEVAKALGLPVIVGEWGCYPNATEGQLEQARHLKELFRAMGAGDTYYEYELVKDCRIIEVLAP